MTAGIFVGLILGALLIGVPVLRAERLRRAGADVRTAKAGLTRAREIRLAALRAFLVCIGWIVAVGLFVGALWLRSTGRR